MILFQTLLHCHYCNLHCVVVHMREPAHSAAAPGIALAVFVPSQFPSSSRSLIWIPELELHLLGVPSDCISRRHCTIIEDKTRLVLVQMTHRRPEALLMLLSNRTLTRFRVSRLCLMRGLSRQRVFSLPRHIEKTRQMTQEVSREHQQCRQQGGTGCLKDE